MDNPKVEEPREAPPDWARSMAPPGAPGGMSGEKISPAQRSYLLSLIEKKHVKPGQDGKLDLIMKCLRISEDPEEYGMSRAKASELITWFLKQPDKAEDRQPKGGGNPELVEFCEQYSIIAGRYAVNNAEGILRFYTVDRPTQGRWAGWVFVKVWASDEKHPIKGFDARLAVLKEIAEVGALEAMKRFGQEIGSCAICGRTLTDEESRRIGIGPICLGNM
jgi:hypothetical protein